MKKLIKILLVINCLLCLTGCKTIVKYEYVYPTLPDFTIERPSSVTLDTIPENATSEEVIKLMSINLIKLIDINNQHILYEDAFLSFYDKVKQTLSDQELATGE